MALRRNNNNNNNITALCFVFLLFAIPCFSRSGGLDTRRLLDSGMYEIDYRGPETHSYLPPPDKTHVRVHQRSKGPRAAANGRQSVKKIHG